MSQETWRNLHAILIAVLLMILAVANLDTFGAFIMCINATILIQYNLSDIINRQKGQK